MWTSYSYLFYKSVYVSYNTHFYFEIWKRKCSGKHESGKCDKCGEFETVMHILFECPAYERERFQLIQELGWLGVDKISLKVLLGNGSRQSRVN